MSKVSSEHWQQLKELFAKALEYKGAERARFLDRACGDNLELRKELDSLLRSYESADSFLETPAVNSAAASLIGETAKLSPGHQLQHYEIVSSIGEGGMGEVYLAKDTRLGRRVALKLLPEELSSDPERLRRFKQEARTASTLNHPNVCVVYEVNETGDGHPFIAMEYIEGITLRQRLNEGELPFGLALDIAIQIADALVAAHEAGIIHRDIKPENIMLRPDGYVKVLDFGLAKLTETRSHGPDTTMSTLLSHSMPGMVLGTVAYMSPEQARGVAVDVRTDVWSLGVVIYEMATGRTPFEGSTPTDVIVGIVEKEQPAIAQWVREVPAELERIVRKALRKDRDERYQHVKEMAIDLRSLRREQQLEIGRSIPPDLTSERGIQTTAELGTAARTTTIKPIAARSALYQRLALVSIAVLIVGALGYLGYRWFRNEPAVTARPRFERFNITKLTTNGNAVYAAISYDGKYVAYIMNEGGKQSVWLRQTAVDSSVPIIPAREGQYLGTAFSPDGNYLYYGFVGPSENDRPELYRVPVLAMGATPTRMSFYRGPQSESHDGKKVAFLMFDEGQKADVLVVANADGTNERILATQKWPSRFGWNWNVVPAWSPDDQKLTCVLINPDESNFFLRLFDVRLADGTSNVVTLTGQRFELLDNVEILDDASGVLATAKAQGASYSQLWQVSRDGSARQITNDLSDYVALSLTADSKSLVTIQRQMFSNLWSTIGTDLDEEAAITSGLGRYFDIQWTPDGKILYASDASGSANIYEVEADGSNSRRLTDAGRNYGPAISPDGRYIAFHSNRAGNFQIWRADRDGNNPKQLTNTVQECHWPQFSADGRWVIYEHFDNAGSIWKVPIDGGTPQMIVEAQAIKPALSPDGKWIACWLGDGGQIRRWKLAIFPIAGGRPVRTFDEAPTVTISWEALLRWTADGRNITFVDQRGGVGNLWNQPVDGGPPKQITNYKDGRVFSFDWSRDGRLLTSRGVTTNDVVLMTETK